MKKTFSMILALVMALTLFQSGVAFAAPGGPIPTTTTISVSPAGPVIDGTPVTITGTTIVTGGGAVPTPGGKGKIQIHQLPSLTLVAQGTPVAGAFSVVFSTAGLSGQMLSFRAHYVSEGTGYGESMSGSVELTVNPADSTPPVVTGAASPAANAAGWNNTNVNITWSASDPESGIASGPTPASATATAEGAGQVFTSSATNGAGLVGIGTVTLSIDKTAPVVTTSRTPSANGNGWNNSAVTVGFSATDALSGIDGASSASMTVSTEGAGQSVSQSFSDKAGNSTSAAVSNISIDMTAPSVVATRAPTANAYGWNNTDVTVGFSATDALSGIDGASSASVTVSTEGAGQSVSRSFSDKAGNAASATISSINIDKTAPTVSITGPAIVLQGNAASATVVASDALSGLVTDPSGTVALDTSTSGAKTVVITVTDKAGNSASATLTYTVWGVNGPFAPIVKNGNGNGQFKAGSTVPVKFQLTNGANLISTATGTVNIGGASAAFRWDATAQQYIANVKTLAAGTGVAVTLNVDNAGSKVIATIDLK